MARASRLPARERPDLEAALLAQIAAAGLPAPVREAHFALPRQWRFDFAWPDQRIALEIEGGIYRGGRHSSVTGLKSDMEKYNEAALRGWTVYRVHGDMVRDGRALDLLRQALAATKTPREWLDGILNGEEPARG